MSFSFGSRSSSQEIWLTNADCSESDSRIVDCSHDGIGVENCVHSEDIMIECASDTSSKCLCLFAHVGTKSIVVVQH